MYIVTYLTITDEQYNAVCANFESLFNLAWIFQQSNGVKRFKVHSDYGICKPKDFGWANLDKWKTVLFDTKA